MFYKGREKRMIPSPVNEGSTYRKWVFEKGLVRALVPVGKSVDGYANNGLSVNRDSSQKKQWTLLPSSLRTKHREVGYWGERRTGDTSWMQERFSACQTTSRKELWCHLLGKLLTLFSLEQCVLAFSVWTAEGRFQNKSSVSKRFLESPV